MEFRGEFDQSFLSQSGDFFSILGIWQMKILPEFIQAGQFIGLSLKVFINLGHQKIPMSIFSVNLMSLKCKHLWLGAGDVYVLLFHHPENPLFSVICSIMLLYFLELFSVFKEISVCQSYGSTRLVDMSVQISFRVELSFL